MGSITITEVKTYKIDLNGHQYVIEVDRGMATAACDAQRKQMEYYAGWLKDSQESGLPSQYAEGAYIASRTAFNNIVFALGRIVSSEAVES